MPIGKLAHLFRRANSNKGRVVRALGRAGKHGFWALADQGVASLGSFGIFILLSREFAHRGTMDELGRFGMLFEWMWILNSVQSALIVYPLQVKGTVGDRENLVRLSGAAVVLTLLLAPLVGGIALGVAAVISTLSVGLWAALAAITWQIQETTRRALMAELRFRDAIWGDAVRYLGHVAAVAVLARTGYFSLEGVFALLAATSALGAVVQILQIRLKIGSTQEIVAFARDAWGLGRWVLAGNASSLCTNVLYSANFYYWWGPTVVGIAFALNNLLRFTNPIMFAIASLITPHAARARAADGLRAAKRVYLKFMALGAVILAPYLGTLILLPVACIRFFLDDPTYERYGLVLVLSAVTQGLIYLGMTMGVYLNAIERNRRAFAGQVTYSGLYVFVGFPFTALWGVTGAAIGGLIAAAVLVALNTWNVQRLPDREEPAPPKRGFEVLPAHEPQPAPVTPAL